MTRRRGRNPGRSSFTCGRAKAISTNTRATKATTDFTTSSKRHATPTRPRRRTRAKQEFRNEEDLGDRIGCRGVGGRWLRCGFRAPFVCGGIRRERARDAARYDYEDGVHQPALLDSHRREERRLLRYRVDGRRREA